MLRQNAFNGKWNFIAIHSRYDWKLNCPLWFYWVSSRKRPGIVHIYLQLISAVHISSLLSSQLSYNQDATILGKLRFECFLRLLFCCCCWLSKNRFAHKGLYILWELSSRQQIFIVSWKWLKITITWSLLSFFSICSRPILSSVETKEEMS